jgi:hypothetical protein
MATRNPITNDEIKSRTYSTEARERHDDIFAKRTFEEWRNILGGPLMIAPTEEKISYSEYKKFLQSDCE